MTNTSTNDTAMASRPRASSLAQPFFRGSSLPRVAARIEAFFVRYRHVTWLVQVGMLVVFIALLFGPALLKEAFGNANAPGDFAVFANTVIWSLWFPLIFLSVIFFGRSWCGFLCPMGAATEWANKVGPQQAIPTWVRWPGTPIFSFLVVTVWAQTAGARDHAEAIAIVFGSIFVAAIALGFFFGRNKRAWCRHMCPIGLLLGVFSRIGVVDFCAKRPKAGGDAWTEKTVCPTMIDLNRKTESRHCIECFRCVNPQSKAGLYLRLRPPGEETAAIRDHNGNLSEVLFLFTSTGTALGGFLWLVLDSYQALRTVLGNWVIDQQWYWLGEPGPMWLMAVYPHEREVLRWFDFFLVSGYMMSWMAIITAALAAATAAATWLARRAGGDAPFGRGFVELGYQFLPVAMASLLLGLGGDLFQALGSLGLGTVGISFFKGTLVLGAVSWSLGLGWRLLARQGVSASALWLPLLPGALGSLTIAAAWYPAIFSA
ncbi:MAG TPA: 4Fe-4S binding protein [Rhodospirillales bacterium]|jgi:polyferredoxin|nr:4Fe-4S binding protein [Rhodospirillales bacterium]